MPARPVRSATHRPAAAGRSDVPGARPGPVLDAVRARMEAAPAALDVDELALDEEAAGIGRTELAGSSRR